MEKNLIKVLDITMHAMILQANFRCSEFILERLEKFREQNLELQDFIWKKGLELWEWDSKAVRLILSQSSFADCPRCLKCFLPIAFISYKSVKRWGKTIKAFTGLKSAPWLRWLEIVYNPRVPEACLINMDRQAGPLFHSDKNAN